nr:HNH endonuclease [Actinomycetota bacterium]MDQ2959028.1 HNH endonuclease [Actinomycetota bacterium]
MVIKAVHGGCSSDALLAVSTAADSYLDQVSDGAPSALADADVLAEMRQLEMVSRRLAVAWHALIGQAERRGLAGLLSMPSIAAVLQMMLRVSPAEAKRRVIAAQWCGPRVTMTGDPQGPLLPEVVAGQLAGVISAEQAQVIGTVLEKLPGTVPVEKVAAAEAQLAALAATLRPYQLGQAGERILAHLDPDGVLASDAEHHRRRELSLTPRSDGSYLLRGLLTPTCGAQLHTLLSARSAPRPSSAGVPDSRSYAQRMHDGLEEIAGFHIRRRELTNSGAPVQVIVTLTADQLSTRQGFAETSFGQLLTVDAALKLADEASLSFLLTDARGAVLAEGRSKRIATHAQTLALIARDKGCSFPDCDKPPEWTQRHHVRSWADGGSTDLDNLTLLRLSREWCGGGSGVGPGRAGWPGQAGCACRSLRRLWAVQIRRH